jgi:hypothetical protein
MMLEPQANDRRSGPKKVEREQPALENGQYAKDRE